MRVVGDGANVTKGRYNPDTFPFTAILFAEAERRAAPVTSKGGVGEGERCTCNVM